MPISASERDIRADDSPVRQLQVSIYAGDHLPPHFHIEGRGFRVIVEIETMEVRAGNDRRAGEAMAWASKNVGLLMTEWLRLNRRG